MEEFGFKVLRGTYEDWQTYLVKYEEEHGEPYIPEEGKLVAVGFEDEQTGEIFFKLKIGNGNTEFNDLPYTDKIDDSGMTIDEIVEALDTKQDKLNAGEGIIIETSTGPNMFNIEDSFKSVLTPTGTTEENQDYITSNYIKVKANTTYVISNNYRELKEIAVALYDTDKHFIEYKSNIGIAVNNIFQYYRFNTTQDGYLRFTVYGTNTKIMLNKGTTYLPYEDYVEIENTISAIGGSGPTGDIDYHTQVTNKPTINNVEIDGDLTSSDLGVVDESVLPTLARKSYVDDEISTLESEIGSKQDTLTPGNGTNINNNTISVKLMPYSSSYLYFSSGALGVDFTNLYNRLKASVSGYDPLTTKSYVDGKLSGKLKKEIVTELPTENIDKDTIYMILRQAPTTNNIYDEYMYLKVSDNPETYDWELIGNTEVDLSNYYNKTEVNNLLDAKADKSTTYTKTEVNNLVSDKSKVWRGQAQINARNSITSDLNGIKEGDIYIQVDSDDNVLNMCVVSYVQTEYSTIFYIQPMNNVICSEQNPPKTMSDNTYLYLEDSTVWVNTVSKRVFMKIGGTGELPNYTFNWVELTRRPIEDTAKGSAISLSDSDDLPISELSIMGKSTQTGTPTIDNPVPIVDITTEEIEVTDGTQTQQAELTKTLRGIPVSSGGNYTDNNNQQWLCDTIERYKDGSGKYIQRVGVLTLDGSEPWTSGGGSGATARLVATLGVADSTSADIKSIFEGMQLVANASAVSNTDNAYIIANGRMLCSPTTNGQRITSASQWVTFLQSNNLKLYSPLDTPIETPLTAEELAQLDLDTYYPSTTISANADVVVEYVCDTKNYIDKKFNAIQNAIISLGGNV